jgi:hypothetical protein
MADRRPFPAALVLKVVRMCNDAGVAVNVSGGWGIDAIVGRQTRDHRDLDLLVREEQFDAAIAVLVAMGFTVASRAPATLKQGRETQARAALEELGFSIHPGDGAGRALYQQWIHGPDERRAEAEALLSRLGVDPAGLPAAELRDGAGHRIVLHRLLIDGSRWQDPEAGPAPAWMSISPSDTAGSIDGVPVACAPASLQAMRLDLEYHETDAVLRDLLWLQQAGRLTGAIRGEPRHITGVVPAADVAAAYLRWWSSAFPGPGPEMVETPDDPDRWADDVIDRIAIHSDHSTPDVEYGWEIMLALVAAARDDDELGSIAAGPVEDYLSGHGETVIERVEAQAAADPKYRQMLRGVWQLGMSDEIYARVRAAASDEPR